MKASVLGPARLPALLLVGVLVSMTLLPTVAGQTELASLSVSPSSVDIGSGDELQTMEVTVTFTNQLPPSGSLTSIAVDVGTANGGSVHFIEALSSSAPSWTPTVSDPDSDGISDRIAFNSNSNHIESGSSIVLTLGYSVLGITGATTLTAAVTGTTTNPQIATVQGTQFSIEIADTSGPKIVSALTLDENGDGLVDAFDVTFDEQVDAGSLLPEEFFVDGVATNAITFDDANATSVDTAIFSFAQGTVVDTAALPQFTYAGMSAKDPLGNLMDAVGDADLVEEDGAAPLILGVSTQGDGNGAVDGLVVDFTESVDYTTAVPADFTFGVCTCANPTLTGDDVDKTFLVLGFDAEGDTALLPTIMYEGTSITDDAGNALAAQTAAMAALDAAPPVLLAAETRDLDSDGDLDAYRVEASEPIADSSLQVAEWSVGGTAATDISTGQTPNDPFFLVAFDQDTFDTGATPQLTYTAMATLTDIAGNQAADVGDLDLTETDGAPPVLRLDPVDPGDVQVDGMFSEGVEDDAAGALEAGDFTYNNAGAGGATTINGVTHTAGAAPVTIEFDTLVASGDYALDGITPTSAIRDSAGLEAVAQESLLLPDRPFMIRVSGNIGGTTATAVFTEDVDNGAGGALAASDFGVTPATGSAITAISSVTHPGAGGANTVDITFDAPLAPLDVGGSGTTLDLLADAAFREGDAAVVADATSIAVKDRDVPGVVDLVTMDRDGNGALDAIKIVFDEPVDDAAGAVSNLDEAEWSVVGATVSDVVTGASDLLPNVADDDTIFLILDEGDLASGHRPLVSYEPMGTVTDLAEPANDLPAFADAATADGAAPFTTLAIDPASPDGLDGWYSSTPTVTLTTNEADTNITYTLNEGTSMSYAAPFTLPDGEANQLNFSAVDQFGNTEATRTSATFKVDATAPGQVAQPTVAVEGDGLKVQWGAVVDETSGISHYILKRGSQILENVTGATHFVDADLAEGSYTYTVQAVDKAGNLGAASEASELFDFVPGETGNGGGGSGDPPTEAEIIEFNKALSDSLKLSKRGGNTILRWTIPADPPAELLGIQVWVNSGDGFVRLATLSSGTQSFEDKEFEHFGSRDDDRYLLTGFFSLDSDGGYSQSDPDDVPGFADLGDGKKLDSESIFEKAGLVGWIIGAVLLVLLVALIIWLIVRAVREDQEDLDDDAFLQPATEPEDLEGWDTIDAEAEWTPGEDEAWPDATFTAGGEPSDVAGDEGPHDAYCPQCSQHFQIRGVRPLVAQCPSCDSVGRLPLPAGVEPEEGAA
ncbi:MAG: chitobiase/beta-hexosaminidase C-terminal domain-containing protein [Thermoplasmatota archaeon]